MEQLRIVVFPSGGQAQPVTGQSASVSLDAAGHMEVIHLGTADHLIIGRGSGPKLATLVVDEGRASATLKIADPFASRGHAMLRWHEPSASWLISDIGSTNGTYLAGKRLRSHLWVSLACGVHHVRVGRTILEVMIGE